MKSLSLQFENRPFSREENGTIKTRRAFPLVDYHYQATTEAPAKARTVDPVVTPATRAAEIRSFRQLSRRAVGSESRWEFAVEAAVFSLIVAIVAWPLLSLLTVMAQTAYGW
ncbi:hypothetical protein BH20VER3_BH20VER3_17190 [soil metagenome]